jgi:hypothetical protein
VEVESAKAMSQTVVHDNASSQNALVQATHRMQQLDTELAEQKARYMLLRKENDAQTIELRKLQAVASSSGDRASSTESDARRMKAQAQVTDYSSDVVNCCYPRCDRDVQYYVCSLDVCEYINAYLFSPITFVCGCTIAVCEFCMSTKVNND